MNKVLLIGLDGATFRVLNRAFELGYMPNLYKVANQGIRRELIAPLPAESPISWPVIVTGCNPAKTGIFGWYDLTHPLQLKIESSKKIRGKAIWDILGSYGLKSIIINVPMTYPPYPINGIMISGFPNPYNNLIAHPPHVQKKLQKIFPDYKIEPTKIALDYSEINEEVFMKEIVDITRVRTELCLYLMENYEWDFLFIVYTELDRVQHVFYTDNTQVPHSILLLKYLQFLDKCIGKILEKISRETTVIITSDHGFEEMKKYIAINNFLERKGYLKRSLKYIPQKWYILTLLRKLKIPFTYQIALKMLYKFSFLGNITSNLDQQVIDMKRTKAYCPDLGYIYTKDEKLLDSLIRELYNLRDPETNKLIIKKVYKREEIFSGPFLDAAPSLLIIPEEGYEVRPWGPAVIFSREFLSPNKRGSHYGYASRLGVFIFHSLMREFDKSYDVIRAEDICPTILSLFNLPIPSRLDGRTLIKQPIKIKKLNYDTKERIRIIIKELKEKMKKTNINNPRQKAGLSGI